MKTQRTLVENKKTPLLMLALPALVLTVLLSAYYSSLAFAQSGPKTATGVLSEAAPHGQDPTPVYAITDEATGTSYELISGFVELQDYVGQKVTIEGVPVPGPGDPSKPPLLNVTQVTPADEGEDPSPSDKVTLSFELTVEGEPPADAEFLGLTATESLSLTPLTDPDGDGTYTGSQTINKYAPGGPPEPISISPVQIVQGPPTGSTANGPEYNVIKDFGSIKLDGDKTLSASVSFPDDGGQADGIKGNITSISGSAVLVEETPSAEESGNKGYFTVTDETEITKQEDGESVPATFEDLEVGQQVEATYEGAVAESYPTQGNAESITILEGSDNTETSAKLSFELTVEGEPPANAVFSGFIPAEGGISVPLTDPDGDGLYTGSTTVDRFGPRPVPPGTEPVSLPVQIVQGTGVIKDFGLVKIDGDKTFSASVSFEGDDGKDGNNGGSGNGSSGNSGSSSGPGGIGTLPYTGGTLPIAGIAGTLLIGGGLLIRRLAR